MCGRYMITSSFEAMARLFDATLADLGDEEWRPNVSPTETVPVCVSHEGDRTLVAMRWGLLPFWYKTPKGGPLIINARAEELAEKPAFSRAARERRCLVPADGFYEWQGEKRARTPYVVRPRAGGPIAFAGIWEEWRGLDTCAIVTCPANATLTPIHDRMPVVVAPADFPLWLGEAGQGAARLMVPAPDEALVVEPADEATRAKLARPA
jgi:putative SOS response-associated peptidase YedK